MDKEKPKVNNHVATHVEEDSNNLNTNIANEIGVSSQKREEFGDSRKKGVGSEKELKPHNDTLPKETAVTKRLRPRNKKFQAPYTQNLDSSDSDRDKVNRKRMKFGKRITNKRSLTKLCKEDKEVIASVGGSKLKYDIKIDPNVIDRYTDQPVELLPGALMPPPESPETKRRRTELENIVVARQCRLHPSNKKYNQGPVVNPPLISPGKMVGFTPAGQRYEVDLNSERPTWFNSEYARLQFDDATRINVSRMFHDLENGIFLPDSLDPNVERRYFAERSLVTADATKHFEKFEKIPKTTEYSISDVTIEKHMSLLETEQQLLELNKFATLRLQDFSGQVTNKLNSALSLKLTPLMLKKNPIVIETMEKLSTQRNYHDVILPARALLDKMKKLFVVPKGQTFKEYFASEVDILVEKTKNMSPFDILMMTEEPFEELSEDNNGLEKGDKPDASFTQASDESSGEEADDEWEPVEDGEYWVDICSNENEDKDENLVENRASIVDDVGLTSGIDMPNDDNQTLTDTSSGSETEDEIEMFVATNGMLFLEYPTIIILNYFEYI